jgi:arylsulfatase A-like enzyme
MDILPTFAALASASLPAGHTIDGVDLTPLLTGDPETPPRDRFYYFRGLTLEAVRHGPWKLHLARGELYNLADDVGETRNVFDDRPELVERLRSLADAAKEDLGSDGIGPGCHPLGRVANPRPLIADDGMIREGFAPPR